jgi:excisionase family DNA binding protein
LKLLTYDEVSQRLGLAVPTLRRMASQGLLQKIRPTPAGRAVRFAEDDVERLIERSRPSPEGDEAA